MLKKEKERLEHRIRFLLHTLAPDVLDKVRNIEVEKSGARIILTVGYDRDSDDSDLCFDDLEKLSLIFNTKTINLSDPEIRYGGFCETCAYSYSIQTIYIDDVYNEAYSVELPQNDK